jgi:segregation and condensation protein B
MTETPSMEQGTPQAAVQEEIEVVTYELRPALEAILMVAQEPLDVATLAQAVGHPTSDVEAALADLAAEYSAEGRGFELRDLAGGWRFYSRPEYGDAVGAFIIEGQSTKLSQAALETLAVVAYKQPISRSRISAIRGVNVDGVVRTLVTRGLIEELGPDGESGALLYGTTSFFLEKMGLSGLDLLPELAPLLPDLDDLDAELERVAVRATPAEPSTPAVELPLDDD